MDNKNKPSSHKISKVKDLDEEIPVGFRYSRMYCHMRGFDQFSGSWNNQGEGEDLMHIDVVV